MIELTAEVWRTLNDAVRYADENNNWWPGLREASEWLNKAENILCNESLTAEVKLKHD